MKTRNGFVSNSSSTSFCVFGIYVEDPEALCDKLIGRIKETKIQGCSHDIDRGKFKFCPECGSKAWNVVTQKRYPNEELDHYFCKNNNTLGLEAVTWSGGENISDGIYIGINLKSEKLNKSVNKSEVIKMVEDKIKAMFPEESPKFYCDCSYS